MSRLTGIFLRFQQAVIDKYRQCDESIADFLGWMAKVERKLANQEQVQEDIPMLRNQINIVKVSSSASGLRCCDKSFCFALVL